MIVITYFPVEHSLPARFCKNDYFKDRCEFLAAVEFKDTI